MADNGYDGRISLGVNIEWNGAQRSIEDGYSKLKGKLHDLSAKLSKAFSAKLTGGKNNKLENDFKNATFRANELKNKLEELQNKLSEIVNSKQEPILSELDQSTINVIQEELSLYKNLYNHATTESEKTSFAKHIGELQSEIDSIINSRASQPFNEKLQIDIEKTNLKIEKTRYQLSRATEEAELAKQKLEDSQNALKNLFTKVGESLKSLAKRFKNYAQRTLVFYTVIKALRAMLDSFKKVLMADEEFRNDWAELKTALYVAVQPIIDLLLPVMKSLVKIAKDWAIALGQVMAMLSGKTYSQLVDIAKASKQAADDYESMADSAKSAADSTKKQLAAFDDLQQFSGTSETTSTDYESFDTLKEYDTNSVTSKLSAIAKIASGLLVAIGLILLFKGNISWGIGFIIAGASVYRVTEASIRDYTGDNVISVLAIIGNLVSGALVAIGLMLMFKGQIGWGVGFIIGGASMYGIKEAFVKDYSPDSILNILSKIMQTGADVLIAIGLLLIAKCQFGYGIGFVIAGAAIWGIKEVLLHEFSADSVIDTIAKVAIISSTILTAIGLILLVATGITPWSIGFVIASASSLVASVFIDWDSLINSVTNIFNAVIDWIEQNGKLVLGIILCFTGVGLGTGIGLIKEWLNGNGSISDVEFNGGVILEMIKGVWSSIAEFWKSDVAPFFSADWWLGLGKACINGFITGFENGINNIITCIQNMLNLIINGFNKISFETPDWSILGDLAGKKYGINIPNVSFSKITIPKLAQGAVIPANREFLAVLGDQKQGTNIETPLSTMIEAFNTALESYRGNGDTTVVLEVDGREFGRAVVQSSNKENRRIGTKLVVI